MYLNSNSNLFFEITTQNSLRHFDYINASHMKDLYNQQHYKNLVISPFKLIKIKKTFLKNET